MGGLGHPLEFQIRRWCWGWGGRRGGGWGAKGRAGSEGKSQQVLEKVEVQGEVGLLASLIAEPTSKHEVRVQGSLLEGSLGWKRVQGDHVQAADINICPRRERGAVCDPNSQKW